MTKFTRYDASRYLEGLYEDLKFFECFESAAEQERFGELLIKLSQDDREYLISVRDDALKGQAFQDAVALSHIISSMTEEDFWNEQPFTVRKHDDNFHFFIDGYDNAVKIIVVEDSDGHRGYSMGDKSKGIVDDAVALENFDKALMFANRLVQRACHDGIS